MACNGVPGVPALGCCGPDQYLCPLVDLWIPLAGLTCDGVGCGGLAPTLTAIPATFVRISPASGSGVIFCRYQVSEIYPPLTDPLRQVHTLCADRPFRFASVYPIAASDNYLGRGPTTTWGIHIICGSGDGTIWKGERVSSTPIGSYSRTEGPVSSVETITVTDQSPFQ